MPAAASTSARTSSSAPSGPPRRPRAAGPRAAPPRRSAPRARAAQARPRSSSTVPSATSTPARITPTRSQHLLDLAHQVAGEHDRAPALGERADERAHLGHAGRVEPVGGLVEDQQLRVLEQRGGDAEALLHAHRVGPSAVAGAVAQPGLGEHGVDALGRRARRGRRARAGCRARTGTGKGPAPRPSRRCGPARPARRARRRARWRRRSSGGRARAASAASSSCRRRWARGSRRPRRGARAGRARRRRRSPRRSAWSAPRVSITWLVTSAPSSLVRESASDGGGDPSSARRRIRGSPEEDDDGAGGGYLRVMLARLRTTPVDALIALAIAIGLELQIVLGGQPGADAASVVAGLAITLPLAWRRRAPLAIVLDLRGRRPAAGGCSAASCSTGDAAAGRRARRGRGRVLLARAHTPPSARRGGLLARRRRAVGRRARAQRASIGQSFLFSGGLIGLVAVAGRPRRPRAARCAARRWSASATSAPAPPARSASGSRASCTTSSPTASVLMVLQAQGARRILDHDPERAREALEAIEETGQTALAEIRRSLGILREDGEPRRARAAADARRPRHARRRDARAGLQVELRGHRRAARRCRRRRPLRVPDRPGGADQHDQARRAGARRASPSRYRARRASCSRSPTTGPAAPATRDGRARAWRACASASGCYGGELDARHRDRARLRRRRPHPGRTHEHPRSCSSTTRR